MGKKLRIAIFVLVALVLGTLMLLFLQPPQVKQPVYRGKPLGLWLDFGQPTTARVMADVGTNAIPWLLHEASAHELGLVSMLKIALRNSLRMNFVTASEHQDRAKRGLIGLGNAGGLAVSQGLSNSDKWIRFGCVGQWEVGQKFPDSYVPDLLKCLDDTEPMVRGRAANAIGMVHQQPEKAVPALIKLLDDPNQNVRCMAALGLSLYNSDAKAAVPALLEHLSNCTPGFVFFATNALKAIGPVTAASTNTNSSAAK
jgi:HEAT repeats